MLQWEVYFCVEDAGEQQIFQTEPIPIDRGDNEYAWRHLHWALPMRDNYAFRFKAFLVPILKGQDRGAFFWFSCDILANAFTFSSPRYSVSKPHFDDQQKRKSIRRTGIIEQFKFGMRISLKAHYRSDCYFEDDLPTTTYIVSDIMLKMEPQHMDMLRFIESERHKLVCVARIMDARTGQCLLNTYLGRAQRIETEDGYEPRSRTYSWKAKEEEEESSFPGFTLKTDAFWDWNQTKEQHNDMLRLKVFSEPLSARTQKAVSLTLPYMPDNDAFSNKRRVLPITVRPEHVLSLCFFNIHTERVYGITPLILKWADFVSSTTIKKKQQLQKQIHATNVFVEVDYQILQQNQCCIQCIRVRAKNYQKSLLFEEDIGKLRRLNSI